MHLDREIEPNPGGHCVSCPFSAIFAAWPASHQGHLESAEDDSFDEAA
jgi:hypothetical protein